MRKYTITRRSIIVLACLIMILFLVPTRAYAYLDPGLGSMLLQIILGVIFAVFFTIKNFWRSIINFFKNKFSPKK